jgi:putative endonuclease
MKTTSIGRGAETAVAKYLTSQGFSVLSQNWRTPRCEIDIVAKKDNVIYFVEVKYRANTVQGDGFDYVTSRKLRQLNFASEVWVQENNWAGDLRILAAAVSGEAYQEIELLEV